MAIAILAQVCMPRLRVIFSPRGAALRHGGLPEVPHAEGAHEGGPSVNRFAVDGGP